MNAHFVLRIATDRDWAADVRAQVPLLFHSLLLPQSYWLEETNRVGKCNHYMYRGEAVFFARFDGETGLRFETLLLRRQLEVWTEGPGNLEWKDGDQHQVKRSCYVFFLSKL